MTRNSNLIILGNGFDLDLGLDTSFASFVKSYEFQLLPHISFVCDLKENNWSDVEGCIRNSLLEYSQHPDEETAKEINDAWKALEKYWGTFLTSRIELSNIKINQNSCAYSLLSNENLQAEWYSFNYTHPRYLCGLNGDEPICIHNECIEREFAKEFGGAYFVPTNLIIGVDTSMPENILANDYLKIIVKKKNTQYRTTDIIEKMEESSVIVLFGHSLGITDSDYFRDFFLGCISGLYRGKSIYIVTRDNDSLEEIKKNLQGYGVNYDRLVTSGNRIISVFTKDGADSEHFIRMIAPL